MKKIISLGFVGLCALTLVACGSDNSESENSSSTKEEMSSKSESNLTEKSKTTSSEKSKEVEGDFVATANDAYFDGTTLKGNTYTIKITSHKVIQPGETGNEHSDKPVLAFWYDTLVSPDYDNDPPIDASTAWLFNFEAVQDNDPNKINELNTAFSPDDAFSDTSHASIKPGGVVSNAVAYELTDDTTPVTLISESFGKEFGKTTITLK